MIIAFIDKEKQLINLYTNKGCLSVPFSQVNKLLQVKDKILYVTKAQYTTSRDIVNLLQNQKVNSIPAKNISGKKYIHSVKEGVLIIPDISYKFMGRYDIKPLDNDMKANIKSSDIMQNYIKQGILAIIDENGRDNLLIENQQSNKKKQEKIKKDEQDRNILTDMKAEDIANSLFDLEDENVIDLGKDTGPSGKSDEPQTMSELIAMMEGE